MRLYDDPVEVRRGETEGPEVFLWRGRLWKVRAVLAHWVPTGADRAERELWRVEAGRGISTCSVFDLSFTGTDGASTLWRPLPRSTGRGCGPSHSTRTSAAVTRAPARPGAADLPRRASDR